MPFIRTIQINNATKVGIWKISEPEDYFLARVPLHKTIPHPRKRLQHLAGRLLLKTLEPSFPVVKICLTESGRPYLQDYSFHFSISHSHQYAATIISKDSRVGIDIEKISPKLRKIAPKFLNPEELNFVGDDLIGYTLCWSAKEAVYKWKAEKGVELRKHIHLQPFVPQRCGMIDCVFEKDQQKTQLQLDYRVGKEFVLVWVKVHLRCLKSV